MWRPDNIAGLLLAASLPNSSHKRMGAMTKDQPRSYGEVLRRQAQRLGSKIALRFEGRETTYAALYTRTNQLANGLIALGVKPGQRVAHLGKNSIAYFEVAIGASKAGAIACPVNWRLSPSEVTYILNDSEASVLFVGREFVALAAKIAPEITAAKHIIALEPNDQIARHYDAWLAEQSEADPALASTYDDEALQVYTSGTTGRPKGVVLTNRSLLNRQDRKTTPTWLASSEDDVSLIAMPCFHVGGTGSGLRCLASGGTGIVLREFDALQVLELVGSNPISKMFMVPAALKMVMNHPRAREIDYSRLKHIMYGASPIPLDVLRGCLSLFKCGFVQMYGMTETAGTVVALAPEDHDPAGNERMRSAGKPLDGVEVKIVDSEGRALPPRAVGEILIRCDSNMKGYWNLPEETRRTIDEEGWLRTGDAGYLDEAGYLYIHDRVKDMIISGGENIYPAEVENAILTHPGVAEVAVVGVPDERWGEAVKAFVVKKADESLTEAEIMAWARERIAGYKCPKSVALIEALPRNASGKVLRRELRASYWQGRDSSIS
jgi:fatty-acyl-CoA synthase